MDFRVHTIVFSEGVDVLHSAEDVKGSAAVSVDVEEFREGVSSSEVVKLQERTVTKIVIGIVLSLSEHRLRGGRHPVADELVGPEVSEHLSVRSDIVVNPVTDRGVA